MRKRAYDPNMSLLHPRAVSKIQTMEKIIGHSADAVSHLLENDSDYLEIAFKHAPHGIGVQRFVTEVGAAALTRLANPKEWVFDLERSREAGLVEVNYGYGNPDAKVWARPVLIFMRQQIMAEVVAIPQRQQVPPLAA